MAIDVGDRIGDYEVTGTLGAGGMGQVYQVRHTISHRIEAMKVLLPGRPDAEEIAERFLREIRLLASLDHPNRFWAKSWTLAPISIQPVSPSISSSPEDCHSRETVSTPSRPATSTPGRKIHEQSTRTSPRGSRKSCSNLWQSRRTIASRPLRNFSGPSTCFPPMRRPSSSHPLRQEISSKRRRTPRVPSHPVHRKQRAPGASPPRTSSARSP